MANHLAYTHLYMFIVAEKLMTPKNKSLMDYAIPILIIVFILYVSLQAAVAYDIAKKNPINNDYIGIDGQTIEKRDFNYPLFFNNLLERTGKTDSIKWSKSSMKFLLITAAGIFVAVLYIKSTEKNYISNKEYGTATWGTQQEIKKLMAASILSETIKSIKKDKLSGKIKKIKIEEAKAKYQDCSNIIFTQTEKICMYNYELNNNTLIIGGSGSGKTRGYVLPNILQCCDSQYSPSLVVTDPKGEILSKIGKYLKSCGYEIKVLNLKEQNRSFCFNPFKYIMPDRYEEQISSIVFSIMNSRNENKENKSNDPFWDEMAQVLLKAIFYAIYEGFDDKDRNMTRVMELFRWFEVSDHDDRRRNPTDLDRFFNIFGDAYGTYAISEKILDLYRTLANNGCNPNENLDFINIREKIKIEIGSSEISGIMQYKDDIEIQKSKVGQDYDESIGNAIDELLKEIDIYIMNRQTNYEKTKKPIGVRIFNKYGDINTNPALRCWEDFRTKCKGKTAQSVTATALAKLSPFDEEQIRRIFSKDEMELDLVGERKTALFIILPPTNTNYNFIANVLYTTLFEQLEYCATVKNNQQLPVPVRFILDEFYNTGRIPKFENILSYARSFGIGISIILQSLDQIKEMYKDSWGTIVDNCSTFLYLGGIRHPDTLEYISKLLGKGTFDKRTVSQSKGKNSSYSYSYDKIGRELMDPAELQKMPKKNCLLFVSGYNPYYSRKFDYKKHKNYRYTSDSSKKNLFEYEIPQDDKDIITIDKGKICEITHGEEKTSNDGGITNEKKLSIKPIISDKIEIKTDLKSIEDSVFYLQNNVLNMDFEGIEISDSEMEEIRLREELEENERKLKEQQNKEMLRIQKIISEPVKIENTQETLKEAVIEMSKEENQQYITFEQVDEGDVEDDEYIDDELDAKELMESLQFGMDELVVSSSILSDINNYDINNSMDEDNKSSDDEQAIVLKLKGDD